MKITIKKDQWSKWNSVKWYNHRKFSLIPVIMESKKDILNTQNYSIRWLFFKIYTGNSFVFGFSIDFNVFKGFGFDIRIPYLYIDCTIVSNTIISKITEFLRRKNDWEKMSKIEREEYGKKQKEIVFGTELKDI